VIAADSWVVPANGHSWSQPEYTWTADDREVTASRACLACHESESETAETVRELVTAPGVETAGSYQIVTRVFDNTAFEVQVKSDQIIRALKDMNVIRLPAYLTTIETEAFCNIAAEAVILPDGCTIIEPKAFANCENLLYIWIPAGVEIPDDAFVGCPYAIVDQQ
jgi:hypothetical protein